jgi:Xaa-Pro aminopeptidase
VKSIIRAVLLLVISAPCVTTLAQNEDQRGALEEHHSARRKTDTITVSEFQARRKEAMKRLPDGLLLLHARSALKTEDQSGFRQDATFYYFTGLESAMSAILAIDAPAQESWLFVPSKLGGLADQMVEKAFVKPGAETGAQLKIEHVVRWEEFASYIDRRLAADPKLIIYLDEGGFSKLWLGHESNPPGLGAVENPFRLWRRAIEERWPKGTVKSASQAIVEMRRIKSEAEIEVMRRVARSSAAALRAGLSALQADRAQREVEAEIVRECIRAGGEGPSFWPWAMAGPNSAFPAPFASFADYRHLNRVMRRGEVARLDVGCAVDHYEGDVGRTAPVSGRFDPGQRETWELLISAYRAGLATMRDGARTADVIAASLREIERLKDSMKTPLGRKAVAVLLGAGGMRYWQAHGVGLEAAEPAPEVLRSGMVVAFEPIFAVEGQGFYLEDMILITRDGYEILTTGLPYSADEIERLVSRGKEARLRSISR